MRRSVGRMYRCAGLILLVLVCCSAPVAARSWRVGVGGGRVIGYTGTLARYGLPRETLTDQELTDPQALAQYDLVIAAYPCPSDSAVSAAIEQFVKQGGIALTEVNVAPSPSALPGERIGPAPGPNVTFAGRDHPISRPLANAGVIISYAQPAISIAPAGGTDAVVIAEFTDEGVADRYRGKLTGGKKGLPALLLFSYGEGQWLYCGSALGYSLALRGPELHPWLLAALQHLSAGELAPRFQSLPSTEWLLPTVPLTPPLPSDLPHRPRADEQPAALPEGHQTFEVGEEGLERFHLLGKLAAGASAQAYLSWFNESWQQRLEIGPTALSLIEVLDGREEVIRRVRRPPAREGSSEMLVRRRPGDVTVFLDGTAVLLAALDPLAGQVACTGLADAYCQPTAPVYFSDDFMRAEGEANPWETPTGAWELHKVEGEAAQGANPFAFRGSADDLACALAGYWFWDDYDYSVSVRATAEAVGVYANYGSPNDYVLMRLAYGTEAGGASEVSVIRRNSSGERTLARTRVACQPDRWQRLGIRLSGGHLMATLDGQVVAEVSDDHARGWGQVGLHVQKGSALFDDVEVLPWGAVPGPVAAEGPWAWRVEHGTCASAGPDGLRLQPSSFGRLTSAWPGTHDLVASAQIGLGRADQAGLLLRYQGPRDYYALSVNRAGRGSVLRLVRNLKGEEEVLAEQPLAGGAGQWREVSATVRGDHIAAAVNGVPQFEACDAALSFGRVGLACAGKGPALFRRIEAMAADTLDRPADPPTPEYAGIIDLHTWAGRGGSWQPSPDDLDLFWHRGFFAGPVLVRLGVRPDSAGHAAASLALGEGALLSSCYCLTADRPTSAEPIALKLIRAGDQVATASVRSAGPGGFVFALRRVGGLLVGSVNGETALSYRDPWPIESATRVGIRRDAGALLDPSDAEILSPNVTTDTFTKAPADWHVLSGTWEISNRWSCSPGWTWLGGWHASDEARIRTKRRFRGDQRMDFYVGAKMMPQGEKKYYEELRDIRAGFCEDDEGRGYRIIVGGKDNTYSCIERNGQVVAENTTYRMSQAGIHNDWLLVSLAKHGNLVTVSVWDREILRYQDPEPLEGGTLSVGTHHNGLLFPRITIYGQPGELAWAAPPAREPASREPKAQAGAQPQMP